MASNLMNTYPDVYKRLQYGINDVHCCLKYTKSFPWEKREAFNRLLNQIESLLGREESFSQILTHYESGLISHLWTYKFLHQKLDKIKKAIHTVTGRFLFHYKIGSRIQPALVNKIQTLEVACMRIGRMPIDYGPLLGELMDRVIERLWTDPNCIDRDTFHLSLGVCPNEELKGIDINSLEGSLELYGLLSWQEVIKRIPKTAASKKVLAAFEPAIRIAQKTQLSAKKGRVWSTQGLRYYEAWAKIADRIRLASVGQPQAGLFDPAFLSRLSVADRKEVRAFKRKVFADKNGVIPQIAFASDVAHDIKQVIDGLKADDFCFFSLGLSYHAVVIQITCVSPVAPDSLGNYTYRIFNTDVSESSGYHAVWPTEEGDYIEPRVITHLNRAALSMDLFEKLVRYATTKGYTEKDFYETHRQCLIKEGKGILNEYVPNMYPLQSKGVCVYASIEACLSFLLPSSEFKKAALAKLNLSVKKQVRAVRKRQRENDDLNKSSKTTDERSTKRRKVSHESTNSSLEKSQSLLKLAEKAFSETNFKS